MPWSIQLRQLQAASKPEDQARIPSNPGHLYLALVDDSGRVVETMQGLPPPGRGERVAGDR